MDKQSGRVLERERVGGRGLECAERECLNRETWRQLYHGHLLGEVPVRGRGVGYIDKNIRTKESARGLSAYARQQDR